MPRKISRSAEDGRFVSRAEAKRNPATTVEEVDANFVTDAMEAAGVTALKAWAASSDFLDHPKLVRSVYLAMRRAR